jgi:hypothetical protein
VWDIIGEQFEEANVDVQEESETAAAAAHKLDKDGK